MEFLVNLLETSFCVHKNVYKFLSKAAAVEAFLLLIMILNLKH